ncbi:MAG: hypothetical protein FWD23_08990 [Oscillospiraceae bacterium]|nr:hypothetical protein [Oscillospiraceae bacterium]
MKRHAERRSGSNEARSGRKDGTVTRRLVRQRRHSTRALRALVRGGDFDTLPVPAETPALWASGNGLPFERYVIALNFEVCKWNLMNENMAYLCPLLKEGGTRATEKPR